MLSRVVRLFSTAAANHHRTLGISASASQQEIKAAYKRLCLQHHPDLNPDNKTEAEWKFKQVCEAYRVLSRKKGGSDDDGGEGPGSAGLDIHPFFGTVLSRGTNGGYSAPFEDKFLNSSQAGDIVMKDGRASARQ